MFMAFQGGVFPNVNSHFFRWFVGWVRTCESPNLSNLQFQTIQQLTDNHQVKVLFLKTSERLQFLLNNASVLSRLIGLKILQSDFIGWKRDVPAVPWIKGLALASSASEWTSEIQSLASPNHQ
jgi:hypothetical protein